MQGSLFLAAPICKTNDNYNSDCDDDGLIVIERHKFGDPTI